MNLRAAADRIVTNLGQDDDRVDRLFEGDTAAHALERIFPLKPER